MREYDRTSDRDDRKPHEPHEPLGPRDRHEPSTRGPNEQGEQGDTRPYRARLPGFVSGDEIGLGDAIARASRRVGVTPCDSCKRRAATLNRWLVFTGRAR